MTVSVLGLVACLFRVRGTRENNSLSENLCNFRLNLCNFRIFIIILTTEYLYKVIYDFSA